MHGRRRKTVADDAQHVAACDVRITQHLLAVRRELPAQIGPAQIGGAIGGGALEFEHVVEAVLAQLEVQAVGIHRQVHRIARLRMRYTEAQPSANATRFISSDQTDVRGWF